MTLEQSFLNYIDFLKSETTDDKNTSYRNRPETEQVVIRRSLSRHCHVTVTSLRSAMFVAAGHGTDNAQRPLPYSLRYVLLTTRADYFPSSVSNEYVLNICICPTIVAVMDRFVRRPVWPLIHIRHLHSANCLLSRRSLGTGSVVFVRRFALRSCLFITLISRRVSVSCWVDCIQRLHQLLYL